MNKAALFSTSILFFLSVFNQCKSVAPSFFPSFLLPQQNSWVNFGSGSLPSVWYNAISIAS